MTRRDAQTCRANTEHHPKMDFWSVFAIKTFSRIWNGTHNNLKFTLVYGDTKEPIDWLKDWLCVYGYLLRLLFSFVALYLKSATKAVHESNDGLWSCYVICKVCDANKNFIANHTVCIIYNNLNLQIITSDTYQYRVYKNSIEKESESTEKVASLSIIRK